MLDEELEMLRPQLAGQSVRVAGLVEELKEARKEEEREARDQRKNHAQRLQRRIQVTSRMQACVRGWLVRRRFIAALDHRIVDRMAVSAMLPDMLRDQLQGLQHNIHDLLYRPSDHEDAAVKLQAWYRSILARRVVSVVRIAEKMRLIAVRMNAAVTRIQSWYRGLVTRQRMQVQIRLKLDLTRQHQWEEMQQGVHYIIKIQTWFRNKLAAVELRRRMAAQQVMWDALMAKSPTAAGAPLSIGNEGEEEVVLVDTWRRSDPSQGLSASPDAGDAFGAAMEGTPRPDRELEKLEAAGLVPFYWASSGEVIRHRIGGPAAQKMERRLAALPAMEVEDDHDSDRQGSLDAAVFGDSASGEDHLGNSWDMYITGVSQNFLTSLDADVWKRHPGMPCQKPAGSRRTRRSRSSARRPKKRPCTKVVAQPPSNAELRMQARKESQQAVDRADTADGASAENGTRGFDPHLLLVNAPPLPPEKPRPSTRIARYRVARTARPVVHEDEEEASWNRCTKISESWEAGVSSVAGARAAAAAAREDSEFLALTAW